MGTTARAAPAPYRERMHLLQAPTNRRCARRGVRGGSPPHIHYFLAPLRLGEKNSLLNRDPLRMRNGNASHQGRPFAVGRELARRRESGRDQGRALPPTAIMFEALSCPLKIARHGRAAHLCDLCALCGECLLFVPRGRGEPPTLRASVAPCEKPFHPELRKSGAGTPGPRTSDPGPRSSPFVPFVRFVVNSDPHLRPSAQSADRTETTDRADCADRGKGIFLAKPPSPPGGKPGSVHVHVHVHVHGISFVYGHESTKNLPVPP
jgi:hypothetical protein